MPRQTGVVLRIRGLVQGVGFRPTVWRLARESRLSGEVLNDGGGVLVRAWGDGDEIERFCRRLRDEAPPLARIDSLERSALDVSPVQDGFRVAESRHGTVETGIVPDAATCPACLAEIRDAGERRFRYAFTNCTHCGPRLSIIAGIPYDRPRTSMAAFGLCPDCRAEYGNPADRRFHAQPIACPACGPRLWLEAADGTPLDAGDSVDAAADLLRQGKILAVKGIGGFHLACDAGNETAVAELRRRKRRGDKPFAVMMPDLATTAFHAAIDDGSAALLQGSAAPILLLPRRAEAVPPLAAGIAPGQADIGVMLPYSPLHHLLLASFGGPLVMTSGNRSDAPQCIGNAEAREALAAIADAFVMHDREIVNRVDDSVLRVAAGRPRLMRRARGYAPGRLVLPDGFARTPAVLALGAELKNTFCVARAGSAILSQHIGDLGDAATAEDERKALALYRELFDFTPELVAVDLHPDYAATRLGEEIAAHEGLPLLRVQHHHAHVASCLAENGVALNAGPVLGVALDGLGLGDDGTIWGGEFLLCDYRSYRRVGRFAPVALPGGDQANRQPWRNAYAHLRRFTDWDVVARHADLPIARLLAGRNLAALDRITERGLNAPLASSAGRLFDAVAAMLGIVGECLSFEGEAAQKLEALATRAPVDAGAYPAEIADGTLAELSWGPLWRGIAADLVDGTDAAVIARRFHNGLAAAVATLAQTLAARAGVDRVALSGGVFHNRLLLEGVGERLSRARLRVLTHADVPCGDGGLALGQATIAAARGSSSD